MAEATAVTRHAWAARTLAVKPGDRLLEIGCGAGATLAEVVATLGPRGRIVAIDRSAAMLATARRTNVEAIDAGRVELMKGEWPDVDLGAARFAKIYAFNVAALWEKAEANLPAVRKRLARDGALYLFHQAPTPAKTAMILAGMLAAVRAQDFAVIASHRWTAKPADVVCVIARA